MKNFEFNKAGVEAAFKTLAEEHVVSLELGEENVDNLHMNINPTGINAFVKDDDVSEELRWGCNVEVPEGLHIFNRGIEGTKRIMFWFAKMGLAHEVLHELKARFKELVEGNIKILYIHLNDDAIDNGWRVFEEFDRLEIVQLPQWYNGKGIEHRKKMSLEAFLTDQEEIFFNNIQLVIPKETDTLVSTWDLETNTLLITNVKTKEAGVVRFDMPIFEEVNYNSPFMVENNLLPPGQSAPESVYVNESGRQTVVVKENLSGSTYLTYVFNHGSPDVFDQVTLGHEAVHSEQLLAALIHRYQNLQEELPDPVNLDIIAHLQKAMQLQTERHKDREQLKAEDKE